MAILEIRNISKVMGKRKILDNVSFVVNEGEIFGFLGPNGAGKTTTIKMIMGLLSIDQGEIIINGYSVKKDFEKAMSRVGGIIENPEMYGYLTGRTNLKIYAKMHDGVSEETIQKVIGQVKLGNRIDEKVRKYSLGMRQRLGVAQAMLHNPNLLILDEPTNGLDPVGIKELRDNLRALTKTGASVLVSSHLLSEMELMCDRIGIIDNGRITTVKSLHEMTESHNELICQYRLDVDNAQGAMHIMADLEESLTVAQDGTMLTVGMTREQAAKVAKKLALMDISLYGMWVEQKTLEDAYFEVTTGSKDQIL